MTTVTLPELEDQLAHYTALAEKANAIGAAHQSHIAELRTLIQEQMREAGTKTYEGKSFTITRRVGSTINVPDTDLLHAAITEAGLIEECTTTPRFDLTAAKKLAVKNGLRGVEKVTTETLVVTPVKGQVPA